MRDVQIVLASSSPRRKQILELLDVPIVVEPSQYDEASLTGLPPAELVEQLAIKKVEEVVARLDPQQPVVGADTLVAYQQQILGKAASRQHARQMLQQLSGSQHSVFTGYAVWLPATVASGAQLQSGVEESVITFRHLTDADIDTYLETGEADDKAGAYGIQGASASFVVALEGSIETVLGLPLNSVYQLLQPYLSQTAE